MKIKSLFLLATVAMSALSACQNDDDFKGNELDGGSGVIEGEKTYAVFDIQVGEDSNTRTETPTEGSEVAIHNEATIKNAGLYIFTWETETTGKPEVMQDGLTAVKDASGDWDIPATALMLTSGKKHIVVVANMSDDIKGKLSTAFAEKADGYTKFYKLVAELGAAGTPDNFNIATLFIEGDSKDSKQPFITMSGEADKTLQAGVTQTEAEMASSPNHVKVRVNRLPAKIDVRLGHYNASSDQSVKTELPVGTEDAQVGTVKECAYDVRNQNRSEYVMKHVTGVFVNTPWSAPNTAVDASKYFPIVTEDLTFPAKLLNETDWVAQGRGEDYRDYVTYITENTNETSLRGNTSYVALKASYVPTEECYVNGYYNDETNKNIVTLSKETYPTTIAEGSYSLFNTDYNIAFKIEATAEAAASDDNLRALAGYHASRIANVLGDIKLANVKIANSTTVPGFNDSWKITTTNNRNAIAAATKGTEATLWVKVEKTLNADGKLEQIILTAEYYYSPNADGEYKNNEGINFGSLTCGLYTTDTTGLRCYYRVNIFDPALGATNMMYYSVVRNYSYHLVISKIKSIGYPTQIDLTVDPDEPLTNNTFVQAHIIINQWTYKSMSNVEIGM